MTASDESSSSEEEYLNQRAFAALWGLSVDWRSDLIALLRSDVPLNWNVRNELANAIEGKYEITLELKNTQKTAKRLTGLRTRRTWYQEGKLVVPYIEEYAGRVDDAFAAAADEMGNDDPYWRKRYYYFKRCCDWVREARREGIFYTQMKDFELEDVWHLASCNQKRDKPIPPLPHEFDALRLTRLNALWDLYKDKPYGKSAVELLVGIAEFLPVDNG